MSAAKKKAPNDAAVKEALLCIEEGLNGAQWAITFVSEMMAKDINGEWNELMAKHLAGVVKGLVFARMHLGGGTSP